jgi:histidyl-tRNA synthetase
MGKKLSTQPYKGTSDWLPRDSQVQNYIFATWREVCLRYGYEEYMTPLLESADLYRAKSGEVKDELFVLYDRAERELALRPEMTPSVTRLVASIYKEKPKPIRFFSIAPFYRNEAPQKGRTREFWQLNADVFGSEKIEADLEVMSLAIEIMLAFGANKKMCKLYFNNRLLLDDFFNLLEIEKGKREDIARLMDKNNKISQNDFLASLEKGALDQKQIAKIEKFLQTDEQNFSNLFPTLARKEGYQEIKFLNEAFKKLGYQDFVEFKPGIIRGFDYYNGPIFEVYDLNPDNKRSLFGGGRYNGLSQIFGVDNFPATGFAPGNITTLDFLESWGLLPEFKEERYYCPLLNKEKYVKILTLVNQLRRRGLNVILDLDEKGLTDSLRYANKTGYQQMIIFGDNELENEEITLKNLISGRQTSKSFANFLSEIS